MVTRAAEVTMATAGSSVQREPSMEEILASIRRIIEDSDPGRKQPEQAVEPAQNPEPVPLVNAEAEVETFRTELGSVPENGKPFTLAEVQARIAAERSANETDRPEPEEAVLPPRAPVTLAEIGAQVAAETHGGQGPHLVEPAPAHAAADTVTADWQPDTAAGERASQVPSAAEVRQEPHFDIQPDIELSADDLAERSPSETQARYAGSDEASAGSEPATRLALVSEQTGRQVAAAFEELSEAFANRSKKTFDEMAEEMLRPMLQDWLDNNLPTLVERLVREEIERVARGT